MPSRSNTAPKAILSALANVDRLFLYLDRFDEVPPYAKHDRIEILRSQDYGEIGANGKLLGLKLSPEADYYMCFDDDYQYSPGFARCLLANCQKYGNRAAVGVHGSIFKKKVDSYTRDRKVIHGWSWFALDRRVDVLATCGTLHPVSVLSFDVQKWTCTNIVDISFAREAKKSGVPLRVVGRYKRLVKILEYKQADSIYNQLLANDDHQTQMVRELLN